MQSAIVKSQKVSNIEETEGLTDKYDAFARIMFPLGT